MVLIKPSRLAMHGIQAHRLNLINVPVADGLYDLILEDKRLRGQQVHPDANDPPFEINLETAHLSVQWICDKGKGVVTAADGTTQHRRLPNPSAQNIGANTVHLTQIVGHFMYSKGFSSQMEYRAVKMLNTEVMFDFGRLDSHGNWSQLVSAFECGDWFKFSAKYGTLKEKSISTAGWALEYLCNDVEHSIDLRRRARFTNRLKTAFKYALHPGSQSELMARVYSTWANHNGLASYVVPVVPDANS